MVKIGPFQNAMMAPPKKMETEKIRAASFSPIPRMTAVNHSEI